MLAAGGFFSRCGNGRTDIIKAATVRAPNGHSSVLLIMLIPTKQQLT